MPPVMLVTPPSSHGWVPQNQWSVCGCPCSFDRWGERPLSASVGTPWRAERSLAADSRVLSRPEAGTRPQAGQEGVNLQGELPGFFQTGGLCPALLLPTPGRSPGMCSLCHHPPLACLFINTVLETTVPRNLQRPGLGGRGGV